MTLAGRLVIVVVLEVAYVVATRVVLRYLSWKSLEAEALRTALRVVTAAAYWYLLKPLILSRTPHVAVLARPAAVGALALFASIPLLVGRYELEPSVALMFAVSSIPVAIKEEILFRGIMQNLLERKLHVIAAIVVTSAVFTVWHAGVWSFTLWTFGQIFFASVLLGLVYARSGSLLAVIVIHAAYDALFSFTPLIASPLHENWGFLPLLGSVVLIYYWFSSGRHAREQIDTARA
jgi:membrane protease YdiL (CAAX protease family)